MRIGREIRRRREALGWTLEDLSHHAGLSPRYISGVELDKRDPSLSTVVAIARALGAEPGELMGIRALPAVGIEAAELFAHLGPEAQRPVLQIMRLLQRRRRRDG